MNTWGKALMAAGMLAGLAKPVKEARENNLGLPSFAGALEVKSAIPGRIRFYMPKLKGDAEFAAALAGALSGINVINRSNINSTTGSLLVVYDETAVEPEVLMGAVMRLAGLEGEVSSGQKSKFETEMRNAAEALNNAVMEKTHGMLDAKTALSCVLGITGIVKICKNKAALPGAYTMLWWAINLIAKGSGK